MNYGLTIGISFVLLGGFADGIIRVVIRMISLEQMIRDLPPEAQKAAREFVEYLHSKYATPKRVGLQFKWEGALVHLRDQYPSVELQHEILKEWND
jgi:hypothetical protein